MENENEYEEVEQEFAPQEETTEELDLELEEEPEEDDSVQISKAELTKLKRKAIAYDSTKVKTAKPKEEAIDTDDRYERHELRLDGYSKDEVEAIMDLGGVKALKNPIVQASIETMRTKQKSKDATEPLTSKSPVYKKFTREDFSKMSSAEMEKILQE